MSDDLPAQLSKMSSSKHASGHSSGKIVSDNRFVSIIEKPIKEEIPISDLIEEG